MACCLPLSQLPNWSPPLVDGLRLHIQYIHSHLPYMEAISSIKINTYILLFTGKKVGLEVSAFTVKYMFVK
jgi:hypothetical protein